MRRWTNHLGAAAAILSLFLATGCDGFFVDPHSSTTSPTGTSSTADYVFVANGNTASPSIAVFAVGTGTLQAVAGSPFALNFVPAALAVNSTNTILYVAGTGGSGSLINAYSIASTGILSLLTSNTVTSPETAIALSPNGKWLLGTSSAGTGSSVVVDEYLIANSSGLLQVQTGTGGLSTNPYSSSNRPMDLKFAPNGAYVVAAMGTGGDVVFPFVQSTGAFSPAATWLQLPDHASSDQSIAVSADSTRFYVGRSGISQGLAVYLLSNLSQVGTSLATGQQPLSIALNKTGTNLYVADQAGGTIWGYGIDSSNAVTPLTPTTITATSAPTALAIDNSGNYLLAASNNGSPDLTLYSFTSSGQPTSVASTATGVIIPTRPVAIAATH